MQEFLLKRNHLIFLLFFTNYCESQRMHMIVFCGSQAQISAQKNGIHSEIFIRHSVCRWRTIYLTTPIITGNVRRSDGHWGTLDFNKIARSFYSEKLHIHFCKYILGVHKRSSNFAVYSELGRYSLQISILLSTLSYWHRLKNTNTELLSDAFACRAATFTRVNGTVSCFCNKRLQN